MKNQWKRIMALILTLAICINLLETTAWATDTTENSKIEVEVPVSPDIVSEESQEMQIDILSETQEDPISTYAAGDENKIDKDSYTTVNASKGISISTDSDSYTVSNGEKLKIPVIISTELPYTEDSHAYIGYLAVLINNSWEQITSWWIDGGRVQYTFTLDSNDFDINKKLLMVASVFPADNFTTGASLCDHTFFLTVKDTAEKVDLSDCSVILSSQNYTYDGTEKKPDVTVSHGNTTLTNGIDYTAAYSNNTNAGTAAVTITGIGKYTGTTAQTFTIKQAEPILSFIQTAISKRRTSLPFINPLTKVTDGTVTFSSSNISAASVDPSTGSVTITGVGTSVITASASSDTNYKSGSASYTLTVLEDNGYRPSDKSVIISAESKNTITIVKKNIIGDEENPGDEIANQLNIKAKSYSIDRDYNQVCILQVTNKHEDAKEFYLMADNNYQDLSLEIIKSGSKNSPMVIEPDETLEVELAVFAQNAEHETYTIPVTAYVLSGSEYLKDGNADLTLKCTLPNFDLKIEKLSENESTLKQKYRFTNNGDTLTDLALSVSESLKDYTFIDPVISNYELKSGSSIEFSIWPDLAKMKKNDISALSGNIIASCAGIDKKFLCSFNTHGKDITVTTMGELALKQNGNPYTKFSVIEDSVSLKYFNGNTYVDIADNTTIDDILDENNLINFQYQSNIDLGVDDDALLYEMKIESSKLTDDTADINETPYITIDDKGRICMHMRRILTAEEYYNILQSNRTKSITNFALEQITDDGISAAKDDSSLNGEKFVLDVAQNIATSKIKSDLIEGATGFSWMSDVYDVAELALQGEIVAINSSNPKLDKTAIRNYQAAYAMKAILTTGKIFVTFTNPLIGFLFDLATSPLDVLIDYYSDAALKEAYANHAAIYADILGQQCTNRGSITASFYAPDYSSDKEKNPSLNISSRMSGGGYVDKTDTNYDISLNGKPTNTVSNTGLTEVTIADVPTDNLKPGETNKITLDYDTNPGSHSVTTDTTITLLYPDDTKIAYIDNPNDLQDVRTLPDFAVYPENIYTQGELIAGESTVLNFNVYNRGSRGGWFTATGYDGNTEIFKKEDIYLAAFSGETFSVDWTPKADTSDIRIHLENTSVRLTERKVNNNSATKKLTVRQREVPIIGSLNFGDIYEMGSYSLSVNIEKSKDVSDVAFAIDGAIIDSDVKGYDGNSFQRYQISSNKGLSKGKHTVQVRVIYKSASGNMSIDKNYTVNVLEKLIVVPYAKITSDNLLACSADFVFSIYDTENLIKTEVAVDNGKSSPVEAEYEEENHKDYSFNTKELRSGEHTFIIKIYYNNRSGEQVKEEKITVTLISEEESYFSFTLGNDIISPEFNIYDNDSSRVYCNIAKDNHGIYKIQKTADMYKAPENYTLVITHEAGIIVREMNKIKTDITTDGCNTVTFKYTENDSLNRVHIENINGLDVSCTLKTADALLLTPGIYTFNIKGYISDSYFERKIDIDISNSNQIIDFESFVLSYSFEMKDSESTNYFAYLYYPSDEANNWDSYYLDTTFDNKNRILDCYTTDAHIKNKILQADEVKLAVYSTDELFIVPIKSSTKKISALKNGLPSVLSRDNLNKVSINCVSEDFSTQKIELSFDLDTVNLYGSTLYLPDGKYSFCAEINIGTQMVTSNANSNITNDCTVIMGKDIMNSLSNIVIQWADQFDQTAVIKSRNESGKQGAAYDFQSGNTYRTENGPNFFNISLTQSKQNGEAEYNIYRDVELTNEKSELKISNTFSGQITENWKNEYSGKDDIYFYFSNIYDEYQNCLNHFSAPSMNPFYINVIYIDIENPEQVFIEKTTAASNYIHANVPTAPGTYQVSVQLLSDIAETAEDTHNHVYDSGKVTRHATCMETGIRTYTCTICGATKEESIAKSSTHTETTSINKATLKQNGSIESKCSICGKAKTTTIYYPKTIALSKANYTYNGKVQKPAVTVIGSDNVKIPDSGYTISYSNAASKNAGNYSVTLTFKGNYSGTITLNYSITLTNPALFKAKNVSKGIKISWRKVPGASGYYIYRKSSSGNYKKIAAIKNSHSVSYTDTSAKKNNGTVYTYAVRPYHSNMIGSSSEKKVVRLTGTSLMSIANTKSKKMIVKYKKANKISGFQIQYSTKKNFSHKKTITSSKHKRSKTISNLTKGKTYYVRIRTYKKSGNTTYYSAWCRIKKIKIIK